MNCNKTCITLLAVPALVLSCEKPSNIEGLRLMEEGFKLQLKFSELSYRVNESNKTEIEKELLLLSDSIKNWEKEFDRTKPFFHEKDLVKYEDLIKKYYSQIEELDAKTEYDRKFFFDNLQLKKLFNDVYSQLENRTDKLGEYMSKVRESLL